MTVRLWGWSGRTQVERVRIFTVGSLYVLLWFVLAATALGPVGLMKDPGDVVVMGGCLLVLGLAATLAMREAIRLYPDHTPVPWPQLGVLGAACLAAEVLVLLLPEKVQLSAAIVVVATLAWGAGGFRARWIQWTVCAAFPLLVLLPTGEPTFVPVGLVVGLFFVFTVQSSLWLMGVVVQLERSRDTQAALAVAEERLRFSRDVHDVMGRQLSTIAVQAELAATLSERGDPRAARHILQVRETAHDALREARELARGYRPLDLSAEVDGAVALLKSAGITATADLDGLRPAWHEPVARVIREAVTNVLRHSTATHVEITYADGVVAIRNDGAMSSTQSSTTPGHVSSGTGLAGLAEQIAPSGASLSTDQDADDFVVRVQLSAPGSAQR